MSSYLITNFKGKYNMQAEIDKQTGDFCRDENGQLDNYNDVWIVCGGKGKVFHYGKSVLEFYCPSLGRGHNILKAIYEGQIGSSDKFISISTYEDKSGNTKESKTFDYQQMYTELSAKGIIYDIEETDEEVLFKFKANNIELLEPYIKPKTFGAKSSPFSTKALRKNAVKENGKYVIPLEDLNAYKEITSVIPKSGMRIYIDLNNGFINKIATKSNKVKSIESIKKAQKLSGLKMKEYLHSQGSDAWRGYLQFLKENINEKLKEIK